jgi:hypothetical protein
MLSTKKRPSKKALVKRWRNPARFSVIRQPDPAIHKDERDKRDNAGDRKNKKTAVRDTNRVSGESGESLLKHFGTTMHAMHRICGIHSGDRIHRDERVKTVDRRPGDRVNRAACPRNTP